MVLNRNAGWIGGTLLLCSTLLSSATATPGAQNTLTPVATFTAPAFAQVNAKATPALDKKIDLVFPLVFKKKAQLNALIQAQQDPTSPEYHHFLTPEQIGQRFGANTTDLRAIVRYAQSQGFTVTNVWPNRLFVSATTNVEQAEKAFHIHLQGYNRPKEMLQDGDPTTFFAPDRQPTLPADIAARITAIHGLNNFLIGRPLLHSKRGFAQKQTVVQKASGISQDAVHMTPDFSNPLSPAQVSKVYNLDGLHNLGLNGQGMNIAVFSPTQFYASDVQAFVSNYNITGYTIKEKWVAADGRAPLDSLTSVEAALDCEMIIGQANKATVTLYETVWDTDAHLLDSWNQIATDHFPVVSCSWGSPESYLSLNDTSLATSWDTVLATMVAAGQSVFVASGDAGASDGNGYVAVSMPASSSNVTGVGGTQDLNDSNGAWASEQGWSGSGGGLSVFFKLPSWQTGPGVKNSYSNGMRQVPDVAALADDVTPGYAIYIHGSQGTGWYNGGGTSASTPLWAAATLLMDENTGHTTKGIGNLAPLLYKLNSSSINPAFHDITTGSNAVNGSNGAYPCTVGWDFVTGWGSADFTKLYNALNANPVVPSINSFTPPSGQVGTVVTITGTHFTGATAVKFNGTAATVFSVVSDTSITATVPTGATTGTISVTTPGGTATSAAKFTVTSSGLSISGNVFNDLNGNGAQDAGEGGLAGWTVYLDLNNNGKLDAGEPTCVTDANGNYSITGLQPGPYTVVVVPMTGWHESLPDARYGGGGWGLTLTSGKSRTGLQFGWTQTADINGYVFNDLNGNGKWDSAEPALAGWTVFLDVNGTHRPGGTNPTAITGADGYYEFYGLKPALYYMTPVVQRGYTLTLPNPPYNTYGVPVTTSGSYYSNVLFGVAKVAQAQLTSLSPTSIAAGHASFTLTANGSGFIIGAVVQWNGATLATTYVSSTQLTATVPASDVAAVGTAKVAVVNPGAIASTTLNFTITH